MTEIGTNEWWMNIAQNSATQANTEQSFEATTSYATLSIAASLIIIARNTEPVTFEQNDMPPPAPSVEYL
jgi:hypothetical protein